MFVDRVADAAHQVNTRVDGLHAARMTSAAGAKAFAFGRFGNLEETDLLTARTSRRTRRPAIDSGRSNRENKTTVARSIAREHCVPHLRIINQVWHRR